MASQETKIIKFPKQLSIAWSDIIIKLCKEAVNYEGTITFDFRDVNWIEPFGMTVIAMTLKQCLQNKSMRYAAPNDLKVNKYLKDTGFDEMFLKKPKPYSATTLTLKRLTALDPEYINQLIELIDNVRQLTETDKHLIHLYVTELLTNGFDHSESTFGCYVCAQWHPNIHQIRISVADGGIGIRESLNRSKKYGNFKSDTDAILKAIEKGVTTRKIQSGGLGLNYIRKYLADNKGTLTIISGCSKVNFYYNKIEPKEHDETFNGTIVDIRMNRGVRTIQTKETIL